MVTQQRRRAEIGIVAGYVLRLARESIPLTQEAATQDLEVDLGTVQGWESGRRPLSNVRAGALLDLRRRLAALGADQRLLALLEPAMDADRILTAALRPAASPADHPLAHWVQNREAATMLAWALRGITPPAVPALPVRRRRGPVPAGPVLAAPDRDAFFSHLRVTVESAQIAGERAFLLRRQALYLASYDPRDDAQDWAADAMRGMRSSLSVRGFGERWIEARTTATVAARQGDPELLQDFIGNALANDDAGEFANLQYWAYWLGALPPDQPDDAFMRDSPGSTRWNPVELLRLLTDGLHDAPGTVDLYVHSISALLTAHPWVALADPALAIRVAHRTQRLLDGTIISPRSRQDLNKVQYRLKPN